MKLAFLPLLALALTTTACTYADVKARETLRLGPLREMRPSANGVDNIVTVDAGTDALTDAELATVERALAPALTESFARLGGVPVGFVRVGACKLRAGPNERFVVYVAKCHVTLLVDGVSAVEVTSEALRRTQNIFERKATPRSPNVERDPAVDARECKAVLVDALDAAARMIVDGALPLHEGEKAPLPRVQRALLARERFARAMASGSASDRVAALFDLRSVGIPGDAALVVPLLAPSFDVAVQVAALDALGELCDPSVRPMLEAVGAVSPVGTGNEAPAAPAVDEGVIRAKDRALSRIRVCAALPK